MDDISEISDVERDDAETEREDGEIVDDLEDISDISIPSCGKSDYNPDLLRAISLSSISDSEVERVFEKKHSKSRRNKEHRHKCKRKRKRSDIFNYSYRSRRTRNGSTSSSDDDEKLDKRTLRQLKEAVRINVSNEYHNSLRTRLKAMIDPDDSQEEDQDVEALRTLALITNKNNGFNGNTNVTSTNDDAQKEDENLDKELAELRLEALKSAVIKKHNERKRRKLEQTNLITKMHVCNNKENAENNIISKEVVSGKKAEIEKPTGDKKEDENVLEEDVDVMRAMLLASMSTKITSNKSTIKSVVTSTPGVISNKPKPKLVQKPVIKTKSTLIQNNIKIPSVKPLIINLNSDSESDPPLKKPDPVGNPIDKSVTEFLKKQREEFEAKQAELNKSNEKLLDKSVVKLLSVAQQKEYRLLKQKLLLASKKRKIRRLSVKLAASPEKKNPNTLKKTLQDLQFQKDGRLQMKGKYKELAPLIQKVNAASSKRKQCEERIKKLLAELNDARTELATSHQSYTELVQNLIQGKDNIDVRLSKLVNTKLIPLAIKKPEPKILPKPQPEPESIVSPVPEPEDVPEIETNKNTSSAISKDEETTVAISNDTDVDNQSKYSNYVSPLDSHRSNLKNATNDPLQMLCPYELFGVCKDQDCTYNHCP